MMPSAAKTQRLTIRTGMLRNRQPVAIPQHEGVDKSALASFWEIRIHASVDQESFYPPASGTQRTEG